jgi:uncharacterized protein
MKTIPFLIYCSIGCLGGFWLHLNPAEAAGPSFDCAKASTRAEKAICQDARLGDLDASLLATLKAALEKDPAARDRLLLEERQWVRDRDHACSPADASPQTTNIVDCLREAYQKRIEVLRLALSQPVAETSDDPSKAVCHKIVDRYKALVEADPEAPYRKYGYAEAPIELLADSKSSGVTIEPEIYLEDFSKNPEVTTLARLPQQAPPIVLSKEVSKGFPDFGEYSVRFTHLSDTNLFRLSSVQGTLGCHVDIFFTVKDGLAKLVPPDNQRGIYAEDACGSSFDLGKVDGAPFALSETVRPNGGTSEGAATAWADDKFGPSCTIHFEYAPRFMLHTPNHERDESCKGPNCDALRQAALHLAEFVNSNQTDAQKLLTEKLSPQQRRDFGILKEKSNRADNDQGDAANAGMTDVNPLLLPLVFENQLYLARVGHFTVGWRTFPDWSVVLEQRDKDTVTEVASFAIGMTNGKLLKATVQ